MITRQNNKQWMSSKLDTMKVSKKMNLIDRIPSAIAYGFLLCAFVGMIVGFGFLLLAISKNDFALYIMDNAISVQYFSDAIILIGTSSWMFLIGLWIELKLTNKKEVK